MIARLIKKAYRNQKGITGLETAIILIAFVVVAAVFAYTVLSAGLFSSQESQEAIYAGLEETQSTVEVKGTMIVKDVDSNDAVELITFSLGNALDGQPIDFTQPYDDADSDGLADSDSVNRVVINMVSENWRVNDIYWTKTNLGQSDGDDLLEKGEKIEITLGSNATEGYGDLENCLGDGGTGQGSNTLTASETFSIEVVPPVGATLIMERTLPAVIDDIMHVY